MTTFGGHEIDLSKWRRFSMVEAILELGPEGAGAKPALGHNPSDTLSRADGRERGRGRYLARLPAVSACGKDDRWNP